jgi:hypothetical protein
LTKDRLKIRNRMENRLQKTEMEKFNAEQRSQLLLKKCRNNWD